MGLHRFPQFAAPVVLKTYTKQNLLAAAS